MTVRYFYMDPEANPVELTDRVWTAVEWNSSAEEANAVASEWVLEDPDSDLDGIYAWRRVYCLDPDAPADHTVIGMGFIADMHIGRSEVYGRSPTSRAWRLTITDLNYMLQYPLFDEADSPNRAVETDLARIAWYLTTQEAQHFPANTDYIDTTGGVNLDANDLLNRSPYDLVRGAMDQSGRNCFVLYDESKGGPDFDIATNGELAIWYAHVGSDLWHSDVWLSNDLADIDPDNGVFALGEEDNDYHPDPSRIYWKLHGLYDGGLVTVSDTDIRDEYTGRETIIDCSDLTDSAKVAARVNRMLVQSSIPNSRIAWGYYCRSDYVNALLAGQTFQYRATHLGGLGYLGVPDFAQEGGVQMRAMDRTVREVAPGVYYVSGSAVPTLVSPPPGVVQWKYGENQITLDTPASAGNTLILLAVRREAGEPSDPFFGGFTTIAKANNDPPPIGFARSCGMWYRVATSDESGVTFSGDGVTYELGDTTDRGVLVEVTAGYAGVFAERNDVSGTSAMNAGGSVSPPTSGGSLVIGVAAIGSSDLVDPGDITEDSGTTELYDQWDDSPRLWIGYKIVTSTSATSVGGTITVGDAAATTFCGITAVFD